LLLGFLPHFIVWLAHRRCCLGAHLEIAFFALAATGIIGVSPRVIFGKQSTDGTREFTYTEVTTRRQRSEL